ncbi:enoyl-CoA hydratase/isomerase family protein [Desulfocicer niacini]
MSKNYVSLTIDNGVGRIQFNRPEKYNAVNPEVLLDLEKAVVACESDPLVHVVVLTGNKKAFVAGADIAHMATADVAVACELADLTRRVQERLADLPKPTIASISGYALGAGCELALCCDFRVADESAVLGLPEITLGIIPGGGGTQRLARLVGMSAATRMVLLGETINAKEAKQIGLVDSLVPPEALEAEVAALADKICKRPVMALRAAKTAMRKGIGVSLKDGLQMEQDLFCMLFGTMDQKEGMAAFMEKRKPQFKGV